MPNLLDAINRAMSYAWDESHGYSQVSDGLGHPGFDCSGLISRCLYEAGFQGFSDAHGNLEHVGTASLVANSMTARDALGDAGFIETQVTSNVFILQPGDIVVMNHLNWSGGHAFFYMENVYGYTSTLSGYDTSYPNTKGNCPKAKIEASDIRSWNVSLADDPNPLGAHTEVWVHNFDWNYLFGSYHWNDPNDQIVIAHYPGGLVNPITLGGMLFKMLL